MLNAIMHFETRIIMLELITEDQIFAEASMMWNDCQIRYICVEGDSDLRFLKVAYSQHHRFAIRALNGWEKVYKTICLSIENSFPHIYGIIDRDYHLQLGDGVVENNQLSFTDHNDIEMMLFCSSAFNTFLTVYGSSKKLEELPNPQEIIISAAAPIGALRLISLQNNLNLWFDGCTYSNFVDKNTVVTNRQQLVDHIVNRTRSHSGSYEGSLSNLDIKNMIDEILNDNSPSDICNGHDILNVLSIALQKKYASISPSHCKEDTIFDSLLMGYKEDDFLKTNLFHTLERWKSLAYPNEQKAEAD